MSYTFAGGCSWHILGRLFVQRAVTEFDFYILDFVGNISIHDFYLFNSFKEKKHFFFFLNNTDNKDL